MVRARIVELSWFLFIFLTHTVSPTRGEIKRQARRIRRSGPNVCGGQNPQCCTGWQPANVDQGLCIQPICNFNCGTGVCVRPNLCLCENGQYNPTCAQSDCKVRCLNGGTCRNDRCQCRQGFEGRFCGNPICTKQCLNGGQCIAPNTCACLYGFAGPQCQSDFRQGPCYKEVKDLQCQGQVSTLVCTKELCCATVGKAWGSPCERCPAKPVPCAIGYLPDYESRECLDIDECKAVPGVCGENGKCINTVGSYRCQRCNTGFNYDEQSGRCVDIDECSDRRSNRCLNGRCLNTVGSFQCICGTGFVLSSDGSRCERRETTRPHNIRQDLCFKQAIQGRCVEPISDNVTRAECCCSNIAGYGWSAACQRCPNRNTDDYTDLCGRNGGCTFDGDFCSNGECKLTDSGLRCVCDVGYLYDPSLRRCVDVDECEDGGSICENARCINTQGNFACECEIGFIPADSNRLKCVPRIIDGPGETSPTPPPTPGTRTTSSARRGECSRVGQQCENGLCVRENGVLTCRCNAGFTKVGSDCVDVNECSENSRICQNGLCVNEVGGYSCQCAAGYIPSNDQKRCLDRNECSDLSSCANGQCINTAGAWRCTCNSGFALSVDEKSCIDIDECNSIDDVCMNGRCQNTAGDYVCRCNTGYTLSTDKHMCLDTMESRCYANYVNNVCSQTLFRSLTISQCCCGQDNTVEKRRAWGNPCMACPAPNTEEFRKVCVHGTGKDSGGKDIDECSNNIGSQTDLCINGRCQNTNGDYICDCNPGYRRAANRKECVEVNECREDPSLCRRGRCENIPGSYRCVCPDGYAFDSRTRGCEDVNECEIRDQCIDGTCINTLGSFRCQCPQELTLHRNGRYCEDRRKAKCWRRRNSQGLCEDNVNGDVTQEVCCQTLGKAWGSPCEECPSTGKCQKGYGYKNFTCVDIDECVAYPGICRNGRCVNTVGSFQCTCSEGWTLDESRSVCLDERVSVCYQTVTRDKCSNPVRGLYKKDTCCCSAGEGWGDRLCEECPLKDTREFDELCRDGNTGQKKKFDECNLFPGVCANGVCVDTSESFFCECRPGYALDETGKNCTDINECELTPGLCGNGTCINIGGGFRCNCREGFKNAPMMMEVCIDVNECDDLSNPCQGGSCVNTIGSFKCECPQGKRMDSSGHMCQDINECAENTFICPNGNCQNFMGGYQCACFNGFMSSDDMKSCIDVNECETDNGQCEASCQNIVGSYRCACPVGLRLRDDLKTCADINECVERPDICGVGNKCQNVYAGHECVCSDAYALSDDRKSCIDIDECVSNPDLCRNGECQNLMGSFRCICAEGFVLDDSSSFVVCSDVNECETGQAICDRNANCLNTIGSYSCSCREGFQKFGDICRDINECVGEGSANRCGLNAMCVNNVGSYTCQCKPGFIQAGDNSCRDIDECDRGSTICGNGKCLNMPGSYECECDFGYLLTNDRKGCEDLDECEAMQEFCHHGRCENIPGSFRCICNKGFQLNRYNNNCTDMNECSESGMCLNGRCVNEMGKYRCDCDQDFEPNPTKTACIDTRTGPCHLTAGTGANSCSNVVTDDVLRSRCCCSVGAAWNNPCEECPKNGTDEYKHLCPSGDGFVVDPLVTSLIDINECAFSRICRNGTCINTLGSFVCTCSRGFEYIEEMGSCEDIDECRREPYICGWTGLCMNTIGSYACECPPGETKIGNRCVDERPQQCFKDRQDLSNIEGSTPGSSCNETLSYRLITRTECCCSLGTAYGPPDMCKLCPIRLTDEYYALCGIVGPTRPSGVGGTPFPPGGTPGVMPVTDVDECSFVLDPCGMGVCRNTYGSYRCDCKEGFAVQNGDAMCKDIDECLLTPCDGGRCKNTFGSFMCACDEGYIVDETGLKCVDHNECHLNSTCVNGRCVNLVGDYRCLCNLGYQPSRQGKACADIDECSNGNGKCRDGRCINTPGSYICQCNEGFREDSRHICQDIDECSEMGSQVCRNGICRNTIGAFSCQCNIGYTLDDSKKNCRDMDECTEIAGYCSNGTCTNTIGGSKCECTTGFTLSPSGDKCIDIDECDEEPNLCEMDGTCLNTAGSFRCICPTGYKLANYGRMCVDMRPSYCFDNFDNQGCSKPRMVLSNKQTCCCTKGAGWGEPCDVCPAEQTHSFTLLCPKGPGYSVKNNTVDDVNECNFNPELCKNGQCINNDGSYRCQCYAGYVLDDTGRNCRDVNECATPGICGNGTCTNSLGSYSCSCAVGFRRGRSSPSCEDIDECSETRSLCAFRCVNTPGAYNCICPRGYKLHADGRHCTDVDECVTGIHNCGYVCKNFVGGFKCICPEGFRRVAGRRCIDIDECREDSSRCPNGACRNTAGSYICDCNEGYKRTSDGKSCEDLSRGLCFSQVDNGICKGSSKMMLLVTRSDCCCSAGVAWGSQCILCPKVNTAAHQRLCVSSRKVMNECSMISNLCPNGKCIDTSDSYRCMCNLGYQLSRNGKSCVDVDECARTPRPCRTGCVNTLGSFRCTCPAGYQDISGVCQDVDECQNGTHNCPQTCQNTVGSYRCVCRQGYRWTGTTCADINECERQNICGFGSCVNQPGSYSCLCQRGYRYNPQTKTCVDLNECNVRTCQGTCVNLNGGYRCGCPSGYVQQLYWNRCTDVNECITGANKCGRTKCANIRGGYRCYCPQGFQLDRLRMVCRDTNECSRNPCSTADCYNVRGGFQCSCPTGFYPIGGGHCISRYGQTCYNCANGQQQRQVPKSIVTGNKYKFGENPQTGRRATPARYSSQRAPHYQYGTQSKSTNQDPFRYTYSYSSSSGQRRKRTSHFVHKLKMTVPHNVTARDNLLVLTPVLESLLEHFHYEILRGNRSLFAIKIEKGVSILYAKKPLKVGRHRLYLKGKIDNPNLKLPVDGENQIEFTGSGDEKKEKSQKSKMLLRDAVGVSEARKFHLDLSIIVE